MSSSPEPSVSLRQDLESAAGALAAIAPPLLLRQSEMRERVHALNTAVPEPLVLESLFGVIRTWEQSCVDWHAAIDRYRKVWGDACLRVETTTGVCVGVDRSLAEPLSYFVDGGLETRTRVLANALIACETWSALRIRAEEFGIEWTGLPSDTTLEQLSEAVAVRQVETERALERAVAPQLLQNRLREYFAQTDGQSDPTQLLSVSDWKTILDTATRMPIDSALRGLALRLCADSEPELLTDAAERQLNAPSTRGVIESFEIISFLSTDQLMRLWAALPQYRVLIQGAIVRASCISRRSEYWYWDPVAFATRQDFRPTNAWGLLLQNMATLIVKRAGISRLRAVISELVTEAVAVAIDPQRAWQNLWDHIGKPISCTDRSRFFLRQLAHERLFRELRLAVQEQDLQRAILAADQIEKADLDETYEKFASEIKLSTRSIREHFREDIEEVLQLVEIWRRAVRPTGGRHEETSLKDSLRTQLLGIDEVKEVVDADPVHAFTRWLLAFGRGAGDFDFSADFPPEDPEILHQSIPASVRTSPLDWRVFGSQVERNSSTWSEWSIDQLARWSGSAAPNVALRNLRRLGYVVAASQAAEAFAEAEEIIDVALVGEIRAELISRRANLTSQLDAIEADLSRLSAQDRQVLGVEVPVVPEPPTASACETFVNQVSVFRQLLSQTLASYAGDAERKEIADKLHMLGRPVPSGASTQDLEVAWRTAWEETAPLRAHLAPVRLFRDFIRQTQLTPIIGAADRAITQLEAPEHWCRLSGVGDLELYLDALFLEILKPAWMQAGNWLPQRRRELEAVTMAWLSSLAEPQWLADRESPRWQALNRTAELELFQPRQALEILAERNLSVVFPEEDATLSKAETIPTKAGVDGGAPNLPTAASLSRSKGTILRPLRSALENFLPRPGATPLVPAQLRLAFAESRWEDAGELAGSEYRRLEDRGDGDGRYAGELLADFGGAVVLSLADERPLDLDATGVLMHAINRAPDSAMGSAPGAKARLSRLFELAFFDAWASEFALREPVRERVAEQFRSYVRVVTSELLPGRLNRWLGTAFTPCATDPKVRCLMLDAAWEALPRDSGDTSVRGWLLWMTLQTSNWPALQRLLVLSNPEVISKEQAQYFRLLMDDRERNFSRFASFIDDLRMRSSGRPVFLNFTERLLHGRQTADGPGTTVKLMDTLQRQRDGRTWMGQLRISPPDVDPPATLTVTLPESGALRFAPGDTLTKTFDGGPFLYASEAYCAFSLTGPDTTDVRLQVRISGKTLTDKPFEIVNDWDARLCREPFDPPTPQEINLIFRDFSPNPARGDAYVQRPWDERTIQQSLFSTLRPGSMWLRSPRRSGKTSILLRLVDEHSCRKDRPTPYGVIHINMKVWNHYDKAFSRHVWDEFWGSSRNRLFRQNYSPESEGKAEHVLRRDDVGIFLQEFSDFLIQECPQKIERIYYLLDEADKLREMQLAQSATERELCRALLWQSRDLVQSTNNIGLVFASARSADHAFAEMPSSPFYNSITRYELQPFSVATEEMEKASRAIVQPYPLTTRFEPLPCETLLHVLGITRGLPFYMHRVAGATFAAARSPYVSRSDVNRAVDLLLQRQLPLASQQMDLPGMDELTALEGEGDPRRRILAKGVLLAAASMLNGFDHPYLLRNKLFEGAGPLKAEARLSDDLIKQGLDVLLEFGFLYVPTEKSLHLGFFIPILGESLRIEFRTQWNDVIHKLEELGTRPLELRSSVETFLLQAVARHESERRELLLSSAGLLLHNEFPGPPVYEVLGYTKLGDLVRSFDGLRVVGGSPRERLQRATASDLHSNAIQLILELIDRWEEEGRDLTAAVLGNKLIERFGEPIHLRLGYQRLLDFLYSISDIVLEGVGVHRVVRRATGTNREASAREKVTRSQVVTIILDLATRWELDGRELTVAVVGNKLIERFGGPIHQRLNFPRLLDFLDSINEIGLEGSGAHIVVRARRG